MPKSPPGAVVPCVPKDHLELIIKAVCNGSHGTKAKDFKEMLKNTAGSA
jgi:hypothetical protein